MNHDIFMLTDTIKHTVDFVTEELLAHMRPLPVHLTVAKLVPEVRLTELQTAQRNSELHYLKKVNDLETKLVERQKQIDDLKREAARRNAETAALVERVEDLAARNAAAPAAVPSAPAPVLQKEFWQLKVCFDNDSDELYFSSVAAMDKRKAEIREKYDFVRRTMPNRMYEIEKKIEIVE